MRLHDHRFLEPRSVTGSRHLIQPVSSRLLLDCGMFQGRREQVAQRNRRLGFDLVPSTAVCLSHPHIDHSEERQSLAFALAVEVPRHGSTHDA